MLKAACFITLFALFSLPAAAEISPHEVSKQRLLAHLENQREQTGSSANDLRQAIETGKPFEYAMDPRRLLEMAASEKQKIERLIIRVKAAPAANLPNQLAEWRIACKNGICIEGLTLSFLQDVLIAYGPLGWPPLQARWPSLDEFDQESLVYLSGQMVPGQCQLAWLDTALTNASHRVRFAALRLVQNTCPPGDLWPRLDQQLETASTPEFVLAFLDIIGDDNPQSPHYRLRLLEMVQKQHLPLDTAFGKICTLSAPRLPVGKATLDTTFWLKAFLQHPERQMCLLEAVMLQLETSAQLEKLLPVFQAAAAHKYGFNTTTGLMGAPPAPAQSWDGRPDTSTEMLALFQSHLTPEAGGRWLKNPALSLGERMVLAKWQGEKATNLIKQPLELMIAVTDATGKTVSTEQHPVRLNEPFRFTVTPLEKSFQTISYQGTLGFDEEKLRYTINDFLVGLQPAGAGFGLTIPLSGEFKTTLVVAGQPYTWQLRINTGEAP